MSIVLIPIGSIDEETLEHLRTGTGRAFQEVVKLATEMPEPTGAFNEMRNQYGSVLLLPLLREQQAQGAYERVLGVIDRDLFHHEFDFVFTHVIETTAIISLARLRPEFEGLAANRTLFEQRALTEAIYVLGRTYRLHDCRDPQCVMFRSYTVQEIDRKGTDFCPRCRAALE